MDRQWYSWQRVDWACSGVLPGKGEAWSKGIGEFQKSYRKFELLQELVENNDEHRRVTSLFDWYILTVANPDGYEETFTSNRYQ